MRATAPMTMPSTDALERIFGKAALLMEREILPNGQRLGPVDLDARLVQPGESAGSDASNDNRVDLLIVQRLQGIARAMGMMLVAVCYHRDRSAFGVHDDERRR